MFIILYDENKQIKVNLNSPFNYKGIHIFKMDDDYYFRFDYPYFIDDSYKLEIKKYIVKNSEGLRNINIYVYNDDIGINDFKIYKRIDFKISSFKHSDICTLDEYLNFGSLKINDGYIESEYEDIFINDLRYSGNKLKNGDKLSILGLEIYLYDDFLYINHFKSIINIKTICLPGKDYFFKENKPKILNHYKSDQKEIKIDEIKPFKKPNKINDKKLIYQIGPSITMSLAMAFIACINIYNSYNNNGFSLSLIALGIMPLTIMFSGILWPVLNRKAEKKTYKKEYQHVKNKYLDYLNEYEAQTLDKLKEFKDNENYYRFNQKDISDKLFFISATSKMFGTINIGAYTKSFEFNYELTGDQDIDDRYLSLKNQIANIGNIPLYLNLFKNKRISIISDSDKLLLKKILLELAYKYSNEDLKIAIYVNDGDLFESIYSLPHLFNEKNRLIFNNVSDLILLSSINDKKIVLLTDMEINYSKDNLAIVKFCKNRKEILKESSAIIEDRGITSLYESDSTNLLFDIDKPAIDYDYYFNLLSKVEVNDLFDKTISFINSTISLNIKENYLTHDHKLRCEFAYENDSILDFDLHESKDGPHGLVGGSTGSGKSELLISMLLALALRYPPDYLNIILIDYKGGGIKESLTYNDITIPHIIASVDNLEEDSILRLLVAIDHELKKRESLFKKLSSKSHISIMSIDDYLNTYRDFNFPIISHLIILVDEFAELKKQNPELIKELVSFSRIGRSLGLHLILATQKPNGVIDDEIWSNSHFKIALKVHDEKDSKEIIRTNEAASLNRPGEFYLNVDNTLRKARAIYAKQDISANGKYEIGILNNKLDYSYKKTIFNKSSEYESSYLCKKIIEASNDFEQSINKLDFKRPISKTINELIGNSLSSDLVFGEVDDYLKATKGILSYKQDTNLFIYSTRNKEINNIIYQLNKNNRRMVIISDKKYGQQMVGDVINYDDEEELNYLFRSLFNDLNCELTLIIENLNILLSYDEKYLEILQKLVKRSSLTKLSLIIITTNSIVNYKLLNSFSNKLVININDKQDLVNIFGIRGEYLGKSFYFKETAIPFVEAKIETLIDDKCHINPYLLKIPEIRPLEVVNDEILIGYIRKSRKKLYLRNNEQLLITSFNSDLLNKYRKLFNFLNIHIERYDNHLCMNTYQLIVWIGDGVYSQRLFYPEKNVDLNKDSGYLYQNGQGEIIELINHE